ncbi:MAG: site-specific DNA-methyltransferase [Candidatus Nanopusillus acidilobi]|jgi:DNA modification methylase
MSKNTIIYGDVYSGINSLEDSSISVVITSPPYWKQRDYGFEGQIGQEKTPEEYIGKLITIFEVLKDKLTDDGVFYLNIGDKYLNKYGNSHLLQIPYRLAYHMIEDGWILEDIIIWYKTNHMPSSIDNRFTNSYEPVFVFAKNKNNKYGKSRNILKLPLQQTKYKHTAVFPEKLVQSLLEMTYIDYGDTILDPFAGTGTVGVVVNRYSKNLNTILIEKSSEYVEIMKYRLSVNNTIEVEDLNYLVKPIAFKRPNQSQNKLKLLETLKNDLLTEKYGEVFIANNSEEFLASLTFITTNEFKTFHREDAVFFIGVKDWKIDDLYYPYNMINHGYILRNMLVIETKEGWYPVFMFVLDSKRVSYRFYIDHLRKPVKEQENRDWNKENFIGLEVKNSFQKPSITGHVSDVIERYQDGFPKIVSVLYKNNEVFLEFVLHPSNDEIIRESLIFKCYKCGSIIEEPFDPIDKNFCSCCGAPLWQDLETVPIVEEPDNIVIERNKLSNMKLKEAKSHNTLPLQEKQSKSKFKDIDRINWGGSPGARKLVLGEYFTKVRLYKVDQSLVGHYLTILRKSKNFNLSDIEKKFPSYKHKIGHWFRKDMGGSTPLPEDIEKLKEIFGIEHDAFLDALSRTVLKLSTVKSSIKGRIPSDFWESDSDKNLKDYLRQSYLPLVIDRV